MSLSARSPRGFTLIEALLALALMSGAGVTIATLSVAATRTVLDGRDRTLSVLAADAVLAREARPEAAVTGLACLEADGAGCRDGIEADGQAAAAPSGGVYRRRWRVRDHSPGLTPGRVVVTCVGPVGAMRDAPGRRPAGTCLGTVGIEVRP